MVGYNWPNHQLKHLAILGYDQVSDLFSVRSGNLKDMKVISVTQSIPFELYEFTLCKLADGSNNLILLEMVTTLTKENGLFISSLLPRVGSNALVDLPMLIFTRNNLVRFILSRADGVLWCRVGGVDCSKQDFVFTLLPALHQAGCVRRKQQLEIYCFSYDGNSQGEFFAAQHILILRDEFNIRLM